MRMSETLPINSAIRDEVIDQVPYEEVDRVLRDFLDAGAVRVQVIRTSSEGTLTVRATFGAD
jgi:hypothetical protein